LKILRKAKACSSASILRIDLMPIQRIGFGFKDELPLDFFNFAMSFSIGEQQRATGGTSIAAALSLREGAQGVWPQSFRQPKPRGTLGSCLRSSCWRAGCRRDSS
jgi:hypothetical protein